MAFTSLFGASPVLVACCRDLDCFPESVDILTEQLRAAVVHPGKEVHKVSDYTGNDAVLLRLAVST